VFAIYVVHTYVTFTFYWSHLHGDRGTYKAHSGVPLCVSVVLCGESILEK